MSIDRPKVIETPSLVTQMREIFEDIRRTADAPEPAHGLGTGPTIPAAADIAVLEGVADGLIVAYEYAKLDDDPVTLSLVEQAMLHVGRRLARAIGPGPAGLPCH